jgi:Protein of unknown function (DUF2911)
MALFHLFPYLCANQKMPDMKRLILLISAAFILSATNAQLTTPQPSPTQTVKQNFGLSSVELSYSRPGVKGRKIFGDLVPFGKVWRTGANTATTLTFGDEVTIGGKTIPAGKYGLLTIPEEKSWTIIITKQTDVTSPAAYKEEEDVVRVTVTPTVLKTPVETFTIQFANIKPTTCDLHLMWDKTAVSVPITTDIDKKVMGMIEKEMKGDNPPYFDAAMYYMNNNKDLVQALEWFNKASEAQPDAYWVLHQKANCLAKLGKKKEARDTAEKSKELAIKQKNDDYVKLNEKLIASL